MEFTATSGGIPEGFYQASFIGIEEFNGGQSDYGAAVVLRFKVIGGQYDGQECSRVCSAKLSPKCNLTKFAIAFRGGALSPNEKFNFDNFVGLRGNIHVEATESGSTRVATFLRAVPAAGPKVAPAETETSSASIDGVVPF